MTPVPTLIVCALTPKLFDGDVPVGGCQLRPRTVLPLLERIRHLRRYPFDACVSPNSPEIGYRSTFLRAGFKTVARRMAARPIMRYDLGDQCLC